MEQHFFACFVCLRYMERRHGVPAMDRKKRGDERAFLWVWYVTIPTFYVVEKIAVLSDFMRYPACLFFVSKGEFLHRRRTTTIQRYNVVLREEFFAVIFFVSHIIFYYSDRGGENIISKYGEAAFPLAVAVAVAVLLRFRRLDDDGRPSICPPHRGSDRGAIVP